jgi:hypothetical protein
LTFAIVIIFFSVGLSIYLNMGVRYNRTNLLSNESIQQEKTSSITSIRFLTSETTRVKKNYENPPHKLGRSHYNITTHLNSGKVTLCYQFPIWHKEKSILILPLEPNSVSYIVDQFGMESEFVEKNSDGFQIHLPAENSEVEKTIGNLNVGSFFLSQNGELEIDYPKLIHDSVKITYPIAYHIVSELRRLNIDGYFERVQAVLNFVQFIPYGIPDFDQHAFYYFGLALPPESLVLNYSDCDSKSILFASILCHLIDNDNIILVTCNVSEGNNEPEAHMMVGVKGLGINEGQKVEFRNEFYHLLETTNPCSIGAWHWNTLHLNQIIKLHNKP